MVNEENIEKGLYLSVIVPFYNEEGNVVEQYGQIYASLKKIGKSFEIIFINDGSKDNTLEEMKNLSPLKIINFRKNFGQTATLDAGFKISQGELIVTMDGDLQNDPADIVNLITKINEGYDVVSGWRKKRYDPFLKKFISKGANLLRKFFINDNISDSGCGLKIYKSECLKNIDLYGEMHRFVPALLSLRGYKIGEIEVLHHPRKNGYSKYNWKRTIKGFLDMISIWFWKKYANRPLHLFGSVGLILIFVSIIAGIIAVYKKIFLNLDLSDTVLTQLSLYGFLMGVQFVIFGLLADIMSKNYYSQSKEKPYDIKEIIIK